MDIEVKTCRNIKLLEFVMGNFFDISDDETAFVIWHGDTELLYQAQKYSGRDIIESYPATFVVSSDNEYSETVEFNSNGEGFYRFGKLRGAGRSTLSFVPATDTDLSGYIKVYPGNE